MIDDLPDVKSNYSYFPIFVEKENYGIDRDDLYEKLKQHNIFGRRYFYPLISTFYPYKELDSASKANLPIATKLADRVICLPMHHNISDENIDRIVTLIRQR